MLLPRWRAGRLNWFFLLLWSTIDKIFRYCDSSQVIFLVSFKPGVLWKRLWWRARYVFFTLIFVGQSCCKTRSSQCPLRLLAWSDLEGGRFEPALKRVLQLIYLQSWHNNRCIWPTASLHKLSEEKDDCIWNTPSASIILAVELQMWSFVPLSGLHHRHFPSGREIYKTWYPLTRRCICWNLVIAFLRKSAITLLYFSSL